LLVALIALPLSSPLAQEALPAPANAVSSIPLCKERAPQALEYPGRMVEPAYPEAALKAGIEGAVELRAVIAGNGKTQELTLVKGVTPFSQRPPYKPFASGASIPFSSKASPPKPSTSCESGSS